VLEVWFFPVVLHVGSPGRYSPLGIGLLAGVRFLRGSVTGM